MQCHWSFEAVYLIEEPDEAVLLLNIIRKPYMGSPIAPSHLPFSDLEDESQGH